MKIKNTYRYIKSNQFMQMISAQINLEDDIKLYIDIEKGDLWLTQKAISELYDIDRTVATKHLKNIFDDYELDKDSVCAIFAHTAKDGKTYKTNYYNLLFSRKYNMRK
jgi:hypothetical protein